ncbi:hypothetical protein LZ32DRAFT_417624 [Colletotrichum eremochloae]|nr:hypothetical protein LZ32DRAFT_417624 [Colletotrichum eremochloae]
MYNLNTYDACDNHSPLPETYLNGANVVPNFHNLGINVASILRVASANGFAADPFPRAPSVGGPSAVESVLPLFTSKFREPLRSTTTARMSRCRTRPATSIYAPAWGSMLMSELLVIVDNVLLAALLRDYSHHT